MAGELDDSQADEPIGYLVEVPFLECVSPAVQVDLLAELWQRHRVRKLHEASLLDAAVLYACRRTAGRLIEEEPDVAHLYLKNGPRHVRCRLGERTPERLLDRFFAFWDDDDFIWLSELEDLTPEHARTVRDLMRLPDEAIEPMYSALNRYRASPDVLGNLRGLLTDEEIHEFADLVEIGAG